MSRTNLRSRTRLLAWTAAGLLLAFAPGLATASPVGFNPDGDATGDYAALSLAGDATAGSATECDYGVTPFGLPCFGILAASVDGDSQSDLVAVSVNGHASAPVAICAMDPLACLDVPSAVVGVPTNAVPGPDADGDGVPKYLEIQFTAVTVDADGDGVTTAPGGFTRVTLDSQDNNPNSPLARVFFVNLPTGAVVGPDADGDGFPSGVTLTTTRVTADTNVPSVTTAPGPANFVRIDPDDADPKDPVFEPQIPPELPPLPPTVSGTVPSGAATGPDADGDGVPATVSVTFSRVTFHTDDGQVELTPVGASTFHVDPDDANADDPLAVSPDGDVNGGAFGISGTGDAGAHVLAVSGTGDATACQPELLCAAVSGTGNAQGYFAVSGTGNAQACEPGTDYLCTAASGAGDAQSDDYAVSLLGDAEGGDVAVSGTGHASGAIAVSGCDLAGVCA